MAKTKISEFNSNPALNTDIDSINLAEGCAPSGINDAIRELMSQLKDWQAGTSNDPMVIGSSGSLTLNQGTANGVAYLNGSKVVTSGSALVFDGSNLGLGVTPSAWYSTFKAFQFGGYGSSVFGRSENNTSGLASNGYVDSAGNWKYINSNYASYYQQLNSQHQWYTAASGTAGNAITFTQAMTLDASGNLGIGTTSPSSYGKLAVAGNAALNTNGQLKFYNSGNSNWSYIDNPSTDATAFMRFTVGSGEAARIDSSGNLGIGTSSPSNTAGFSRQVQIQGSLPALTLSDTSTGTGKYTIGVTSGNLGFWDNTASAYRMYVDSSGNLLVGKISTNEAVAGVILNPSGLGIFSRTNGDPLSLRRMDTDGAIASFRRDATLVGTISVTTTATAYNTSSDYRLKNTIAPMTGALAKVAQLKPCTYKWNADGSDGEGFIAHELAEVVPQCVSGEKDAVDAEGNPQYQGIDVSFLVATLTAAIQELKAEFDAYKASHP